MTSRKNKKKKNIIEIPKINTLQALILCKDKRKDTNSDLLPCLKKALYNTNKENHLNVERGSYAHILKLDVLQYKGVPWESFIKTSRRLVNILKRNNFTSLDEILMLTREGFLALRSVGVTVEEELYRQLKELSVATQLEIESRERDSYGDLLDIDISKYRNMPYGRFITLSQKLCNVLSRNNIFTIEELLQLKQNEFKSIKGVGYRTENELYTKLKSVDWEQKTREFNIAQDEEKNKIENFSELFSAAIKKLSARILGTKVAPMIIEYNKMHSLGLSVDHLCLIKDIEIKDIEKTLIHNRALLSETEKIDLLSFAQWLNFDFDSIAKEIRLTLNARELFVLENRAKRTLEEIGNCLNITRERVRQIEYRIEGRLTEKQCKLWGVMSIISIIANKPTMSFPELIEICGESLGNILWSLYKKRNNEIFGYRYDKSLCVIVQSCNEKSYTRAVLARIKELESLIESNEMENTVARISREESISEELVWKYINKTYKQCDATYYSSKITKTKASDFVLRKYFKDGYKIADKKAYMNFKTKLEEIFGFENVTQQYVDAIISKIAVLSGRGMYIHSSNITYNKQLMDEIIEYINESPRVAIMYMELYDEFYMKLRESNINNKDMLHGILKLHCAKRADVGFVLHKDYISKEENANFVSEFTNFVKEKGHVTKKDMLEHFVGLKPINIELLLSQCREIVDLHNKYYIHSSTLNITNDDCTQLQAYLLQKCKYVPKTAEDLYYDIDYKYKEFVNRNAINSPEKLYGILEYMFKNEESGIKFRKKTVYVE